MRTVVFRKPAFAETTPILSLQGIEGEQPDEVVYTKDTGSTTMRTHTDKDMAKSTIASTSEKEANQLEIQDL